MRLKPGLVALACKPSTQVSLEPGLAYMMVSCYPGRRKETLSYNESFIVFLSHDYELILK